MSYSCLKLGAQIHIKTVAVQGRGKKTISFKTDEEAARNVYANDIVGRLVVLQQEAAHDIGCTCTRLAPAAAKHRLHAWRWQLAILHQELELLTFDSAQSRAVGEDGAFIAVGRSYATFLKYLLCTHADCAKGQNTCLSCLFRVVDCGRTPCEV